MGIVRELHLLGARNIVISTNIELRREGLPDAGRPAPADLGVAVYFTYNGSEQCIPCDKWRTIRENMARLS